MEKKDNDNKSLIVFIIIMIFAGTFFMGVFQKCVGSKHNPLEDSSPWQPRHTQIEKPVLNVVNELNFNNYTVS